jgi:hypothetical protein
LGVPRYEYLWEDGVKFKRPTKLPAPEYVDALMNWAQNLLDDEAIFPNKIGIFRQLVIGFSLLTSHLQAFHSQRILKTR